LANIFYVTAEAFIFVLFEVAGLKDISFTNLFFSDGSS